MGTYTEGWVDFSLPEIEHPDEERVTTLLSQSLPACCAVDTYWQTVDPGSGLDRREHWHVWSAMQDDHVVYSCWGPGGMSIWLGPCIAHIHAGVRWRGFLTIPALQQVHRSAFTAIARAIGSTRIFYVPDYAEFLLEAMDDGQTFDQCRRLLEAEWGPTQGTLNEISESVVAECEHCPPDVWYLEQIPKGI